MYLCLEIVNSTHWEHTSCEVISFVFSCATRCLNIEIGQGNWKQMEVLKLYLLLESCVIYDAFQWEILYKHFVNYYNAYWIYILKQENIKLMGRNYHIYYIIMKIIMEKLKHSIGHVLVTNKRLKIVII